MLALKLQAYYKSYHPPIFGRLQSCKSYNWAHSKNSRWLCAEPVVALNLRFASAFNIHLSHSPYNTRTTASNALVLQTASNPWRSTTTILIHGINIHNLLIMHPICTRLLTRFMPKPVLLTATTDFWLPITSEYFYCILAWMCFDKLILYLCSFTK